jgi:GAF domain-containing protein
VNNAAGKAGDVRYQGLALTMTKWFDRLMADLHEEVEAEKRALSRLRLLITLFNIIVVGGVYVLFYQFVLQPLNHLTRKGATQLHETKASADEIGEVARSINNTVEQLKDASDFVMAIGKGDLSVDYKNSFDHTYVPGTNQLADSLIEMQSKLKELNEEEQKRKWANEGLARFVDILRSSNDNINILGDKVIAALVQYTKANQGGLYIVNEDESNKHLELISLFAFDIKKYEQQRVKPGQGILGQTFLEKETTYLTSLPEEYVRISSGLGGANPKSILIVPLKVDREVYGLVELASFNDFQPHEIAFVEKLGESIASTLASVRAAQRNKNLIEQFQQQTEQMRAQEEEMRQNMEELQATQEEVVRKEKNYISRIAELEKALQDSRSSVQTDENVLREFAEKENEYKRRLADLQKELELARKKGEEWEIANELARTLRFNLEALKISEEQSGRTR